MKLINIRPREGGVGGVEVFFFCERGGGSKMDAELFRVFGLLV